MNPDNCPDCARETWYCSEDEQWFHVDPNQECFLTYGKAPTNKHPCDMCGEKPPELQLTPKGKPMFTRIIDVTFTGFCTIIYVVTIYLALLIALWLLS